MNKYLKGILVTLFAANASAMLIALIAHASQFGSVGSVGSVYSWQLFTIKLFAHIALIAVNLVAVADLLAIPSDTT